MGPERFQRPGHLLQRASRLSLRWADERLAPLGLAAAQIPVLFALKDGAVFTQTELARMAQIEQPTMAQLLARMERDGLIRRSAHPVDKRSSLVSLTSKAMKKIPAANAVLEEGSSEGLRGFSDREIATFRRLLMRVVKNFDPEVAAAIEAMARGQAGSASS